MMLRKLFLGIDAICLITAIIIGIDYSYYIANIKYVDNTKTVILDDIITLNCDDPNININNENIKEGYEKDFEVTNLTDKDTTFNIYLSDISNTYENNLVYELYNEEKLVVSKTVALQNGKNYVKINIDLKSGDTKKYKIKFILNNKENIPEEYFADKSFNAYLRINSLKINSEIKTATNYILASNVINTDDTSDGLYKMADYDKVIYYYKGNVLNNYVSFNDELWRIVRINADGSIRIVKNDNISENIRYNDEAKKDDSSDYFASNVKNKLSIYYNEVLKKYDTMLTSQDYCLNLNVVRNDNYKNAETDKNINEYSAIISCDDQNKNIVGILSYNDVILAGLNYNSSKESYLLNTENVNTWLSTKAGVNNYNHYVWYLDKNSIKDTSVTSENSIRPVINLKSTLNITGTGTQEDPYIFIE